MAGCCSEHVALTQALNYVSLRVHHSELCSSGSSILVKKVQVVRWCKLWCGQDTSPAASCAASQQLRSWGCVSAESSVHGNDSTSVSWQLLLLSSVSSSWAINDTMTWHHYRSPVYRSGAEIVDCVLAN